MKKLMGILLAASMVFSLAACGSTADTVASSAAGTTATAEGSSNNQAPDVKVGAIILGDETEGYSAAHINGIKEAAAELGMSDDQIVWKYKIAEGGVTADAAEDLVGQGCNLIISNSYGHQTYMEEEAEKHPDINFVAMTGDFAAISDLDNFYNAFTAVYQSRYVSGVVAGMKVKDLVESGTLTPETHDQSFAMTSSYSNMYLATYLAFNLDKLDEITAEVEKLAVAGQHFLDDQFGLAQKIVDEFDYNRIVYLGNIGLKGVAQESALKTLELTAGKVATMYDSELGFRHGPKSIIDDNTLTVAYLSDDEYRRRYELDLVKEMAHQRKGNKIAVVYNHDCEGIEELADYPVQIKVGADMENVLLGLDFILFAQTIALMKSLSLGITPDNPCPTGEVNRVVKGVTLYPYTLK